MSTDNNIVIYFEIDENNRPFLSVHGRKIDDINLISRVGFYILSNYHGLLLGYPFRLRHAEIEQDAGGYLIHYYFYANTESNIAIKPRHEIIRTNDNLESKFCARLCKHINTRA